MQFFTVWPIGFVRKSEDSESYLEILPEFETGLYRLETISHIFVLWWFDESDTPEERMASIDLPRVSNSFVPPQEMGNLATRSPSRPNPIALTLVKIIRIEGAHIHVDELEAYDGTPVLDIKPYLPNGDRIDNGVFLPQWFEHLLESRPNDKRFPSNNNSLV
ncbi:MAG: tRNA (N6-threonylcarbamoyladenosine(37)-N6)-methyltransferase TrmO [Candidatus Heimdallarchaeota archaeon]